MKVGRFTGHLIVAALVPCLLIAGFVFAAAEGEQQAAPNVVTQSLGVCAVLSNTVTDTLTVKRSTPGGGGGGGGGLEPPAPVTGVATPETGVVVALEAEGIALRVPVGAVQTAATFTLQVEPKPPATSATVLSLGIRVTATDQTGKAVSTLGAPLMLEVPVPSGVPQDRLWLFWWDETLQRWLPLPTVISDGWAIATIDHLTLFMLMRDPSLPLLQDIIGAEHESDILALAGLRLVCGSNVGFEPDRQPTRAEFLKVVVGALGLTASGTGPAWEDAVDIPSWALSSVTAAATHGLVLGYGDGTLKPHGIISALEATTIINRAIPLLRTTVEVPWSPTDMVRRSAVAHVAWEMILAR